MIKTVRCVYGEGDKDMDRVCVYTVRDKGISAEGVICVSPKFIMCSDSLRSVGEEEEHADISSAFIERHRKPEATDD